MPTKRMSMNRLFDKCDYHPHSVQREIHSACAFHRFRCVCAGRRTGKSTLGGHELTVKAFQAYYQKNELSAHGKRHEYWIVGPEYSDAEKEFRVMYNDMTKLGLPFDRPGTYYNPESGGMDVSLWGGKFQVHAKSAKYPNSLTGEALMGVIFAEAAKLKSNIWSKFIRPMLADYADEGSWALFTSTPEGKNWFYDLWRRGQSDDLEDANWWSIRMPSWSNDILFPQGRFDPEIIDMSRDMTEEKFKQEIGAEFTEFVGRVFKRFEEEKNVGSFPYDPRWPLYVACDFGFTNPNVALFIQVDIWDNVWVVGEYYQRNRTAQEFAADVWEDPKLGPLARKATLLFPDPEDPGSAATVADKWQLQIKGGTGGPLSDRLDLIRRWLTPQPLELPDDHPDKVAKLHFDKSCVHTIREMLDYRYPENKNEQGNETKENPLKVDDHGPEALGRFFGGHFGPTFKPKKASSVSRARMTGGAINLRTKATITSGRPR